jgi:hypothetical protein
MPEYLSFNQFIDTTAKAKIDDYVGAIHAATLGLEAASPLAAPMAAGVLDRTPKGEVMDRMEAEFARMKKYVLTIYDQGKIKPKHSFVGLSGHAVDCIPFEDQPGVREARKAKHEIQRKAPGAVEIDPDASVPKPRRTKPATGGAARRSRSRKPGAPDGTGLVAPLARGLVDALGNKLSCPAGHVPLRRVSLRQLTRFGSLDAFFRKGPSGGRAAFEGSGVAVPRSPNGDALPLQQGGNGEFHRYAHAIQQVDNLGSRTTLNVWDPNPDPGVFSLSQLWITAQAGTLQTIESGWQVYSGKYGDSLPHLFIYFTNNNYRDGSGWYNLERPPGQQLGFIQLDTPAARSWVIGGALSASGLGVSTTAGPQVNLTMQWQRDPTTGNWFLYLGRDGGAVDPIGYYPRQLFGAGPLSDAADTVDFGGEVCSVVGSTASGEMGSGQPANAGNGRAAYQDRVYFLPTSGDRLQPASLTEQVDDSDSPFYSVIVGTTDNGKRTFFYFGGRSAP